MTPFDTFCLFLSLLDAQLRIEQVVKWMRWAAKEALTIAHTMQVCEADADEMVLAAQERMVEIGYTCYSPLTGVQLSTYCRGGLRQAAYRRFYTLRGRCQKTGERRTVLLSELAKKEEGYTIKSSLREPDLINPYQDKHGWEEWNRRRRESDEDGSAEVAQLPWHLVTKRQRDMLVLRYCEDKKLEEIAKVYGLTRERVRQVIANACDKLRRGA